jgi:hypothetical protein
MGTKEETKATSKEESVGITDMLVSEEDNARAIKSKDASFDDLKAAKLASLSGEGDKSEDEVPNINGTKSDAKDAKPKDYDPAVIDDVLKEIVEEKKQKESLESKTDRSETNKIAELERKLEKLASKNQELEQKIVTPEKIPGLQPYTDEWYEALANQRDIPVDELKKFITLQEDGYKTGIKPVIDALQAEIETLKKRDTSKESKSQIEKDELYAIIKDDYESILNSDKLKTWNISDEDKSEFALAKAKELNYPKIVKSIKKHATEQATNSRRLIPSEEGSVNPTPKRLDPTQPQLTKEDMILWSKLQGNKKGLDNLGKTPRSFVEG